VLTIIFKWPALQFRWLATKDTTGIFLPRIEQKEIELALKTDISKKTAHINNERMTRLAAPEMNLCGTRIKVALVQYFSRIGTLHDVQF
jgi:hypothetical protein